MNDVNQAYRILASTICGEIMIIICTLVASFYIYICSSNAYELSSIAMLAYPYYLCIKVFGIIFAFWIWFVTGCMFGEMLYENTKIGDVL